MNQREEAAKGRSNGKWRRMVWEECVDL